MINVKNNGQLLLLSKYTYSEILDNYDEEDLADIGFSEDDIDIIKQLAEKEKAKKIKKARKNNKYDYGDDIPNVKVSMREKIKNWFSLQREKRKIKKANKKEKGKKLFQFDKNKVGKIVTATLFGLLSCICVATGIIAVFQFPAIGFAKTLLSLTLVAAGYKVSSYIAKDAVDELVIDHKNSKISKENIDNDNDKKSKSNSKGGSIISKISNLNIRNKVSNVKLTREEKIAKVMSECSLSRVTVDGITKYLVSIASNDIKLQKFIKAEYKKENPEEKIQSLDHEDRKVLVLNNKPNFK